MITVSELWVKIKKKLYSCREDETCKNKILVYHKIHVHLYSTEGFSILFHFNIHPSLFFILKLILIIKLQSKVILHYFFIDLKLRCMLFLYQIKNVLQKDFLLCILYQILRKQILRVNISQVKVL